MVQACLHHRNEVDPILVGDLVLEDHGSHHLKNATVHFFHRPIDPWAVGQREAMLALESPAQLRHHFIFEVRAIVADP